MQAYKTLLISLLALLLSGCERIQPSLESVQAQAAGYAYGREQAALEHLNRQAAVYSGCVFLVNICPSSITEKGREVVEGNHIGGGGDSAIFWIIVALKFLVLGTGLAAAWIVASLGWNRLLRPSAYRLEQAREEVQAAQSRAAKVLEDVHLEAAQAAQNERAERDRLAGEVQELSDRKVRLESLVEVLEAQAKERREKLETLQQDLNRLELAKQAASHFD